MDAMQEWLRAAAMRRQRRGIVRHTRVRANRSDDGASQPSLDLASNDYLGLSTDPRLQRAAIEAIERYGAGSRASRVVTGTHPVHVELEDELCRLTGQPAALAFSSGYTANLGVLTALGGPHTLIAQDEHAHASLVDGGRLSRSPVERWPHGDLDALERLLRQRRQSRAIVVVESVYSVLGDAAELTRLAALCADHGALLLVDEAHGLGVAGGGRGAVHAAGLSGAEHVAITVTLSKALGAQGGAVLGSPVLREHLINTARSFIFDTALAPAPAAAATAACRVIAAEPERVTALRRVAAELADGCRVARAAGAVQSVPVRSAESAAVLAEQLAEQGILVGCFRPPSVPDGISRLRLTARADLDAQEVRRAAGLVATSIARSASTARGESTAGAEST